jgi:lipopolysaccharide/colanic/teichoic acid biosynthesis glycosyltransferase
MVIFFVLLELLGGRAMLDEENALTMMSGANRDILAPSLMTWNQRGKRPFYATAKLCVEWLLAIALTVLICPLLIILVVLVRITSDGPAFYKQARLGYRGRVFQIYKLRTMVNNAESDTGPVWAAKEDRRITSLGAILRTTHLDELPQLLNVLKGEMSLIGPRPERPEIASQIVQTLPTFRKRLVLRPGITGLAQVLLPADDPDDAALEGVARKLEYDLLYADEMRFFMDVRIYICTICQLVADIMGSICRALTNSYREAVRIHRALPKEPAETSMEYERTA